MRMDDKREVLWNICKIERVKIPIHKCLLNIHHARNFRIIRSGKDGPGDDEMFNYMEYSPANGLLMIRTGFVDEVEVSVSGIHITVVDTEEVIQHFIELQLFGM